MIETGRPQQAWAKALLEQTSSASASKLLCAGGGQVQFHSTTKMLRVPGTIGKA